MTHARTHAPTHARTHARTHAHGANYNLPPASRAGDNDIELGIFKYGLLYYVDLILSKVKVVIFMSHATATARVIL